MTIEIWSHNKDREEFENSINSYNEEKKIEIFAKRIAEHIALKNLDKPKRLSSGFISKKIIKGKPLRCSATQNDLKKIQASIRFKNHSQLVLSRVKIACSLMFYTGLRVSEVALLTHSDINNLIVRGYLDVFRPKQNNYHRVHIIKEIQNELHRVLESDLKVIFLSHEKIKGNVSTRFFNVQVNRYLKKYLPDRENLSSHSFRVSYVTWLLGVAGISLQDASRMVGHSSVNNTNMYYRYQDLAENSIKLSQAFNERK
jgi:integrase